MTNNAREIVIEFERVETIRKRAATRLTQCPGCEAQADAVSLVDAAELFEISRDEMFRFIELNDCHYHLNIDDRIYLCVPSLLESMRQRGQVRALSAKGDQL